MNWSALPHVINQVLKHNLNTTFLKGFEDCCYCLQQKLSFVTKMCIWHICVTCNRPFYSSWHHIGLVTVHTQ